MKQRLMRLAKQMLPKKPRRHLERQIDSYRFGAKYLEEQGWFEGVRSGHSVGPQSEPVPWITYPARKMLERAISPSQKLFEYGSGNSSLWWSSKVAQAVAVEHIPGWVESLRRSAPDNLTILLREEGESAPPEHKYLIDDFLSSHPSLPTLGSHERDVYHGMNCVDFGAYAVEPAQYGRGHFDIFVIDGMARSLCAHVAAELIADNGIIIFDNSERRQYNPAFAHLSKRGWRRIDFYGPGPVNFREWCTSIFCRNLEWLSADFTIPTEQLSDLDE